MNIILGVCGSISAYKALDICRGLVKNGHGVKVVLTKGAEQFVRPEVFKYLGATDIFRFLDDFDPEKIADGSTVTHIHLAKWCDRLMVAPLSANTASLLAQGRGQDLLTSIFLALPREKPIILYPAMNTQMLDHPFVQENLKKLNSLKNIIIHPSAHGLLACGDQGDGKLSNVDEIVLTAPLHNILPANKKVLISTGATVAPLDPMRFLTNASSGKTGFYLAQQFLAQGYQVTVIATKTTTKDFDLLENLPHFELHRVSTTHQMRELVLRYFENTNLYISAAAICDFDFNFQDQKIKKLKSTQHLSYQLAPDILKEVLNLKKSGQKIIGFAAESHLTRSSLEEKWKSKPVDLLIGNTVNHGHQAQDQVQGFQQDFGEYLFFEKMNVSNLKKLSKMQLAQEIFQWSQS